MNKTSRIVQYLVVAIILAAVIALLAAMAYSSSIKKSHHWRKSPSQAAVPPVTEDHVRALLAQVPDSELGVNIVDLGLVYGIHLLSPGAVEVTMTLTTPYCPFSRSIIDDIRKTLMADPAINEARLRIVFEPAWTWNRVDKGVRDRIFKQFQTVPGTVEDKP
ncbi:MAG: metal-sulfur cluster assembly factor [Syntrophobacteraceae bacterium]